MPSCVTKEILVVKSQRELPVGSKRWSSTSRSRQHHSNHNQKMRKLQNCFPMFQMLGCMKKRNSSGQTSTGGLESSTHTQKMRKFVFQVFRTWAIQGTSETLAGLQSMVGCVKKRNSSGQSQLSVGSKRWSSTSRSLQHHSNHTQKMRKLHNCFHMSGCVKKEIAVVKSQRGAWRAPCGI